MQLGTYAKRGTNFQADGSAQPATSMIFVERRFDLLCKWCVILACVSLTSIFPSSSAGQEAVIQTGPSTPALNEWFERDVRPLLAEHCFSCHSSTLLKPKGGLELDSRQGILEGGDSGPGAVPGEPSDSLIVRAVRRLDLEMPPDKPLGKRQQDTLARWVEQGMPWPVQPKASSVQGPDWIAQRVASHWAWQRMADATIPNVARRDWAERPLDQFILSQLESVPLEPANPASSHVLVRRLCFDLLGLPPSRELAASFAQQPTDDEYLRLVDRLLASAQFGVKWGRHWFDLVRFAETLGHEFDYPVHHAWRYRDSIIDAFNIDVPYDQFVLEHVAGDLMRDPRIHPLTGINNSLAATGWWWLGESVHAPVDLPVDESGRLDHQIDVFSKTFWGMTVGCARCHDHKFDAISMQDYYALSGILQSSRRIYAPTDPTGAIAQHNANLALTIDDAERSLASEAFHPSLAAAKEWLHEYLEILRKNDDVRKSVLPNSPLYVLAQLASSRADSFQDELNRIRDQISNSQTAWQEWESASPMLARFDHGLPPGWNVMAADRASIDEAMQRKKIYDWFSVDGPLPNSRQGFSSRVLGRNQRMSLLSPTFVLTHPNIALQISGKSAKSTLFIDNYFMIEFHQLLFGDVTKTIDQPHEAGWIHHAGDLKKYLGRRAYLIVEDDGQGWFDLRQVRLATNQPPSRPHPVSNEVISTKVESLEQLCERYAQLIVAGHQLSTIPANELDPTNRLVNPHDAIALVREVQRQSRQLKIEAMQVPVAIELLSEKLSKIDAQCPVPTMLLATAEGTPMDCRVALRGDPKQLGELVARRTLTALGGAGPTSLSSTGRLELAHSMIDREHTLTSRVIVNRVWHYLMWPGLVESPDNFGALGGKPTNAELLDYLSREFVRHDWSMKWLIREIVLSSAYRMASEPSQQQMELDADGKLLSHRSVKRLTAEELRDAMLFLSGTIDLRNSGSSVPIHLTPQMTGRGRPKDSGPLNALGRRSIFIEVRRNFLHPLLVAFDFPAPSGSVGRRNVSNVPAQSLGMLNDPLVFEFADQWARRLQDDNATSVERIKHMFLDAFGRQPAQNEIGRSQDFVQNLQSVDEKEIHARWAELTHIMLNAKEFIFLR